MVRGLLIAVGHADEWTLTEGTAQEGDAGRERAVGKAHGHGDGGEAGLRREDLAVVPGGAGHVTNFAGRLSRWDRRWRRDDRGPWQRAGALRKAILGASW